MMDTEIEIFWKRNEEKSSRLVVAWHFADRRNFKNGWNIDSYI